MKAILEFTLPDEQVEHQNAIDAGRLMSLVQKVDEELRRHWKYEKGAMSKKDIQDLRGLIREEFPDLDQR